VFISWKNTLAYSATKSMTKKKGFITLAPGPNVMELFTTVIYEFVTSWSVCPRQAIPAWSNVGKAKAYL
jgi:hypothetical protein